MADSVTQILSSGPPGLKINIAVLGDGFAEADQAFYNQKVQEFLVDGVPYLTASRLTGLSRQRGTSSRLFFPQPLSGRFYRTSFL